MRCEVVPGVRELVRLMLLLLIYDIDLLELIEVGVPMLSEQIDLFMRFLLSVVTKLRFGFPKVLFMFLFFFIFRLVLEWFYELYMEAILGTDECDASEPHSEVSLRSV